MLDITEAQLQQELNFAPDECCIVFDFGCYFPYLNQEDLVFEFQLGEAPFTDVKRNHRYPNKNCVTLSKKRGRRVSKLGYPYIMLLEEQSQQPLSLTVRIGLDNVWYSHVFHLRTDMTPEKPLCELELHYHFDNRDFQFSSCEKIPDDIGWHQHCWQTTGGVVTPHTVVLQPPVQQEARFLYSDVITPVATALTDVVR